MKKVAVLLCVMICALPLHVQGNDYHSTFVSNQILYGLDENGEAWVISHYLNGHEIVHHSYSGAVVIPDSVVDPSEFYGNNRPVVGIDVSKYDFEGVTDLTLPNTIREIERIEGCAIETIDLPPLLSAVPNLSGCPNLKELILPPTITKVGEGCLNNCPSLTHVHLGAKVCQLDRDAFVGSDALTSITLDEANNCFSIVDDILYSKDQTYLWYCLPCYSNEICHIPETVTYISSEAFKGCESVREVTVPDGVVYLWSNTFRDCVNLRKVSLPESISEIAHYVFLGCRSLEEVNIPSSVEYIGLSAFGDCVNLTQVELPDHLTEILSGTFAGCENLEINIPESIKSIGIAAFANCKKLSKVVLPEAINVVEDSTFYNCSGISELTIKGEVSSIGSYAFTDCSNLKKLNIEKSIGYIGRAAFAGTGIETLEIPESLSRYDASAFILCDSLTVAIIKETNRSLNVEGGSLFRGCNKLRSLYLGRPITASNLTILPALTELTIGSFLSDLSYIQLSECGNLKKIICFGTTPPKAMMSTFSTITLLKGTLVVPASAEEAYRNTLPWSTFHTIETFPDIVPTELRFNEPNQEMRPSEYLTLSATVYPEHATFSGFRWTSSNEMVATVSETGIVHSNKEGEADITVSLNDGALTATCHVSVHYVDAVEEHEADQVSIYPNPVDDMLHIEGVTTGTSITLYDMTGRLVLSDRAYGGAMTFDMSALKRGVYLCRIQNRTYKIVKR